MKGNISIGDFIHKVKDELVTAQTDPTSGDPFYKLDEVQLEVSFALEAGVKGGFKLFVVEWGGETKAAQTHKVTLKLTPLRGEPNQRPDPVKPSGGGGGGGGVRLKDIDQAVYKVDPKIEEQLSGEGDSFNPFSNKPDTDEFK